MQSWLEETEDEVARERDHPAMWGMACQERDRIDDEYEKEETRVGQDGDSDSDGLL
jgi:hypothetical protein